MTRPTINLPAHTCRAVHSAFVDYLTGLDPVIRDAFVSRTRGVDFVRFMLALGEGRYAITSRIVDDDALIGLAITTHGRFDTPLFELEPSHAGIDAQWLIAAGLLDLDDKLTAILGGESQ